MKLGLSQVSHGLKIVAVLLIIACLGLAIHGAIKDGNGGPLWTCKVASLVFDLAFLLFYALTIGARYEEKLQVSPLIEKVVLILGAISYIILGGVFLYYTTGTHTVGKLTINISALPGASEGHALGSLCLFTFLTMTIDAVVVFKPSWLPVATNEPEIGLESKPA